MSSPSSINEASRYQHLLEHLPVGVYRSTVDGEIIEGNNALASILGYENMDQLRHQNVKQFYLDLADRTEHLKKLSVDLTYFSEFQFQTHDGRRIWVRDFPRAVCGPDGDIQCYDGILVDITELKKSEAERDKLIDELRKALDSVKTLRGLLPICAECKKIRSDTGYWEAVEEYLLKHADIRFSHGICPDCIEKLYPEYAARMRRKEGTADPPG